MKKYFIGMILLVMILFATVPAVNAVSSSPDKKSACQIIIVSKSQKTISLLFVDKSGKEIRRNGLLNIFKTSEGGSGFCLAPDKALDNVYKRGAKIKKNGTLKEQLYYKIYHWFADIGNGVELTQIAFWYVSVTSNPTEEGLATALLTKIYQTDDVTNCEKYEKALRDAYNPYFKCECFLKERMGDKQNRCEKKFYNKQTIDEDTGKKDYESPITNEEYNAVVMTHNISTVDAAQQQAARMMASSIFNGAMYDGDLYYYEPVNGRGGYQHFVGIEACDHPGYICEDKYPDYLAGKYGSDLKSSTTIAKFKADILDSNRVKIQDDGTAMCDSIPTNPVYCKDLLDQANANCWSRDDLAAKVVDGDKVEGTPCHLSCGNDCKPVVDVSSAVCDAERKQSSYFTLNDAMRDELPDTACYQKGTAYQINDEKVGSYDKELSNSYCDVYCWESVTADMPSTPSTPSDPAYAGQMMYWGKGNESNGWFARIETKRICWTKPKYEQFRQDWNANENAISVSYGEYINLKNFVDASDYSTESCTDEKSEYCTDYDGGDAGQACCVKNGQCTSTPRESCSGRRGSWNDSFGSRAAKCNSCSNGYHPDGTTCKKDGVKYTRTNSGISATTSCFVDAPSNPDSAVDDLKIGERDSKYAELQGYLRERKNKYNAINACQSTSRINSGTMYTYTAAMEFTTNEANTYGVTNYSLNPSPLVGDVTTTNDTGRRLTYSCKSAGDVETSTLGNNNPCVNSTATIADYSATNYTWTYDGACDFYYDEKQFMFYAIKENMKIVNTNSMPADFIFHKNLYYKEGYGFPLSFTKLRGTYDISVKVSGLGNNGHFDKILEQTNSEETYGYDFQHGYYCPYYVDNPIYDNEGICPKDSSCTKPSGLDIVYRVIDMASGDSKRIFPSIDGDGRNPGGNWSTFISNRPTTYKNITTYSKVYDQSPMYTIELTPTNIGAIRNSNKVLREAGKDPYTSYYDENNLPKITCNNKDDENKSCVSNYITELIKRNVIKSGKFKIESEGQRLNALNNYKTCYDVANPHC